MYGLILNLKDLMVKNIISFKKGNIKDIKNKNKNLIKII
jgi:hypothetical protein